MSTQYTARIIYGFPTEGKVGENYLDEWVCSNHPKCNALSAGHYNDFESFVGVTVNEVHDFIYSQPSMPVGPLLTVSDETVRQVEDARSALVAVDPKVVLGAVGFYLVGSSS